MGQEGSTCTKRPSGWELFEKNCYFFSMVTKSWGQVKQACIDQGSRLVIVNTNLEQPRPLLGTLYSSGARFPQQFGVRSGIAWNASWKV
nr:C-type lectin domain family 4 member E-like isoform X2 [Pelodiscus sinensis]|eukprot:XP_025036202.1 C-type lectin domain family 4 member E-like isoform X2 [Pelodiscus sinensis]